METGMLRGVIERGFVFGYDEPGSAGHLTGNRQGEGNRITEAVYDRDGRGSQ